MCNIARLTDEWYGPKDDVINIVSIIAADKARYTVFPLPQNKNREEVKK